MRGAFLRPYRIAGMRAVLTIQIPTDDWRRGHILAASTDPNLIRHFCQTVLELRSREADRLDDPFDRELARVEIEQLRARFAFALGVDGS